MADQALLKVEDLWSGYYKDAPVLKGLHIEVQAGEIVVLIGSNGSGKTTTINTLSGLLPLMKGNIFFRGKRLNDLKPKRIVEMGMCVCPEGRLLFPEMTVLENLELGAYLKKDQQSVNAGLERIYNLFPRLKERQRQLAGSLSGGEQQMLAIGRSLMAEPTLLLLDEPSLGLAPLMVELLFETIIKINRQGTTILLVEQNARMALEISNRAYVIESGRITLMGDSKILAHDKEVEKVYLGVS